MTRAFMAGMGAAFAVFIGFSVGIFLIAKATRSVLGHFDTTVARGIRRAMIG